MKLIKGKKIIKASEKAFRIIYKARGYKPYNPAENEPTKKDKVSVDTKGHEDMTKAEIAEILTEKGIDFNPRDRKDKLLELLMAGD